MTAGREPLGIEVRRPAELRDPLRDPVRVALLLVGVLQELLSDRLGVDALRHEIVALVSEHAHDLRRQGLV